MSRIERTDVTNQYGGASSETAKASEWEAAYHRSEAARVRSKSTINATLGLDYCPPCCLTHVSHSSLLQSIHLGNLPGYAASYCFLALSQSLSSASRTSTPSAPRSSSRSRLLLLTAFLPHSLLSFRHRLTPNVFIVYVISLDKHFCPSRSHSLE